MDPREQIGDHTESLQMMLDGRQMQIWTCLPGIIQSFDPSQMTCSVQPTVQGLQTNPDGSTKIITLSLLINCPVKFPRGGGFTLLFYPQKGDECEISFSSRCFDAWWQQGGIQPQAEFRMHDLSDGFVFVGPTSLPNVLTDIPENAVQLRKDDGSTYVQINSAQVVKILAPGGCNINGLIIDTHGNLTTPGGIQAGTGTGNAVTLQHHEHPTAPSGPVSPPTPGT